MDPNLLKTIELFYEQVLRDALSQKKANHIAPLTHEENIIQIEITSDDEIWNYIDNIIGKVIVKMAIKLNKHYCTLDLEGDLDLKVSPITSIPTAISPTKKVLSSSRPSVAPL